MMFKKGDRVRVTGRNGGCSFNNRKCIDCPSFKGQVIIVEDILVHPDLNGRTIHCRTLDKQSTCNFREDDLSFDEINWQERMKVSAVAETKSFING